MEFKAGTHRNGGTCDGRTPQGLTVTWVQAVGGKGRSSTSQETAADAGMRSRAQGRVAEAGGWRVWVRVQATSRWVALHTWRGGGEPVKK